MDASARQQVPIFPLNTVLFPDGLLPLRIFEQRYLEMTKACLRDNQPFGVCLIREGLEVGTAAVPEAVGCLASITQWEMPQLGVFHLIVRGGERFRIGDMQVAANHLISARIDRILPDPPAAVDPLCREVLQAIVEKVGAERFPEPLRLEDAAWVGYRLAEVLPLEMRLKQALLELTDAGARLERIRALLEQQGLNRQDSQD